MNVVEGFRIRRKCEAAQIPSRKDVGQSLALLDIQQLEGSRALSTFFDLVEQQTAIGRNTKRPDCGVRSRAAQRRIQ